MQRTIITVIISIILPLSVVYGQTPDKKKKIPADITETKKQDKKEKKGGTGMMGLNLKVHVYGGGALTYPGGDIAIEAGTSAESAFRAGYEAGVGISYMFLGDIIGINLSTRYNGNYLGIKYSGTNSGTYIFKTGFIDASLGVKGYLHFIYLYYETGITFGSKIGDWDLETPAGTEPESSWATGYDFNFNLSYYFGGGVAFPITKLVSLEFGFRYEVGFLPVLKGPSVLPAISDTDELSIRYIGLRAGVTFSI